jgi:hypothetical protein
MTTGLPESCGPEQLMSVVHALTVMMLECIPGPRTVGLAGTTVAWPVVGPVRIGLVTLVTAGPVTTMRMKTVPAFTPLMVAVSLCVGGIAALGPEAEKLRFVGETVNCGGGGNPPPPPPPQPVTKHAISAA